MYVAPTPFALTEGTTGLMTLILPADVEPDPRFKQVGTLTRVETEDIVIGYKFDLRTNDLSPECVPNPKAGLQHRFVAYRHNSQTDKPVTMSSDIATLTEEMAKAEEE
jgi:hypothetical protein